MNESFIGRKEIIYVLRFNSNNRLRLWSDWEYFVVLGANFVNYLCNIILVINKQIYERKSIFTAKKT